MKDDVLVSSTGNMERYEVIKGSRGLVFTRLMKVTVIIFNTVTEQPRSITEYVSTLHRDCGLKMPRAKGPKGQSFS
jgi:hypothetical protein